MKRQPCYMRRDNFICDKSTLLFWQEYFILFRHNFVARLLCYLHRYFVIKTTIFADITVIWISKLLYYFSRQKHYFFWQRYYFCVWSAAYFVQISGETQTSTDVIIVVICIDMQNEYTNIYKKHIVHMYKLYAEAK